MKLPWIQVEDEVKSKSAVLAAMLKVPRPHAIGMLNLLWMGAMDWGRHEDMPDGRLETTTAPLIIAGWCEWDGDALLLTDALTELGFVERLVPFGSRIRGMSRYVDTITKRRKDSERHKRPSDFHGTSNGIPSENAGERERENEERTKEEEATDYRDAKQPAPGRVRKRRESKPLDATWKPLVEEMVSIYGQEQNGMIYPFLTKDGVALAALRKAQIPDEAIKYVWGYALRSSEWPQCRSLTALRQHFAFLQSAAYLPHGPRRPQLLSVDIPRGR